MTVDQGEFRELEFGGNQILVLNGRVVEYFKQDHAVMDFFEAARRERAR